MTTSQHNMNGIQTLPPLLLSNCLNGQTVAGLTDKNLSLQEKIDKKKYEYPSKLESYTFLFLFDMRV